MLERTLGGWEVVDAEDKLQNAQEAPRVGVTFAAGSAVRFAAAGALPMPVPGSSRHRVP